MLVIESVAITKLPEAKGTNESNESVTPKRIGTKALEA